MTGPVKKQERVNAVDVLRGVALLGILLMNILDFGLPGQAYSNPTVAGGATGANLQTWFIVAVLFEGTMRALFSMLFGAGLILMTTRADERGDGRIADIWLRRNLWLVLFGMLHAYLLWPWDILYTYGLFGLLLYPFRKLSAPALLACGLAVVATGVPRAMAERDALRVLQSDAALAAQLPVGKLPLTEELKKAKEKWEEKQKEAQPPALEIEKTIAVHRGSYARIFADRAPQVVNAQSLWLYKWGIGDVVSMMLLGMGLMKWDVLRAMAPVRLYVLLLVVGYGIGVPVRAGIAQYLLEQKFQPMAFANTGVWAEVGRLTVAVGHLGLVMLVCRWGRLAWLTGRLAAVGQMALTNYLSHTVISTTLFYGYGFAMYGRLERHQLYYVAAAIWVFQLLLSPVWLRYFQYGPVEWLWRSLTYWERQPLRLREEAKTAHG